MAIAGSPGIPSTGAIIHRKRLHCVGLTSNKPKEVVFQDMSAAADHLRRHPDIVIQIDIREPNYARLLGYLRETGHVEP